MCAQAVARGCAGAMGPRAVVVSAEEGLSPAVGAELWIVRLEASSSASSHVPVTAHPARPGRTRVILARLADSRGPVAKQLPLSAFGCTCKRLAVTRRNSARE